MPIARGRPGGLVEILRNGTLSFSHSLDLIGRDVEELRIGVDEPLDEPGARHPVDEATGRLTSQGQMPTEPVPRAIGLDPTGRFLYAAGPESGRLSAYRIDDGSGRLEFLEAYPVGRRPMWVLTLTLEDYEALQNALFVGLRVPASALAPVST